MKLRTILAAGIVALLAQPVFSQIPQKLNHQGRVTVQGTNFNGTGQFKFVLVTRFNQNQTATAFRMSGIPVDGIGTLLVNNSGSGYVTPPTVTITDVAGTGATAEATIVDGAVTAITVTNQGSNYSAAPTVTLSAPPENIQYFSTWSNDQTSMSGGEPTAAVSVPVVNGLYSVQLGDTAAGMSEIVPGVFHGQRYLRVWFSDGVNGFQQLTPDQPLAAAPYAFRAIQAEIADTVADEAITYSKLGAGAVVGDRIGLAAIMPQHLNNGAVTAAKLAAGAITPLSLNTGVGAPAPGQVLSFTNDGLRWASNEDWSLFGNAGTSLNTHFIGTTDNVHLSFRVNNQEVLRLEDDIVDVYATNGFSIVPGDNPMLTRAYDPFDVATVSKYYGHGRWGMFMESGQLVLGIPDTDVGQRGFSIAAYSPAGGYQSLAKIDNNSGKFVVRGLGLGNGEQAYLGGDGAGFGGMDVEFGSLNPTVTQAAFWNPSSGQLLNILARDASVRQLTIRGGADLAEPFAIGGSDTLPKGSVVVIDDKAPGQLRQSAREYDTCVAGIISGANGIQPGISLVQEGVNEEGQQVALTGRVYCRADASNGAIKPGDLLTTSANPGHAMKATDHSRTQGAVLGKAMSALDEGTGFVLVLVTLQ